MKNPESNKCEYKTVRLMVEFEILSNGRLGFVKVVESSGVPIYDEYAVKALERSSPFPKLAPSMIRAMKEGSSSIEIRARFRYVVDELWPTQ